MPRLSGRLKRAAKRILGVPNGHPDWRPLLRRDRELWAHARRTAATGPRVLIATSVGGQRTATIVESLLAVALTLRGANVHILLCDEALPACLQAELTAYSDAAEFAKDGPAGRLCGDCFPPSAHMYRALDLPIHRFRGEIGTAVAKEAAELAAQVPLTDVPSFRWRGAAVGEHALAGALRFFARGDLGKEPHADAIVRRYLAASILSAGAIDALQSRIGFSAACFHHGIYVPQGPIADVLRGRDVRVATWNPAYRSQCFIFSHRETYHHSQLTEPTHLWEQIPWSKALEAQILTYLRSRWQGSADWIWFHDTPQEDIDRIASEVGIDFSRPTIGLLTNVVWDAQLHYRANAFPDMLTWLMDTIRYFAKRPELQLLIRVHPAELRGRIPSRQPVVDEIRAAFPSLPSNVFVVPPESQVSTYAAMFQCDSVLIYGTKTGVELTSLGIPVVVAGEAWIRNKGLTLDASSPEEYFAILNRLPLGAQMTEEATQRARKYAYHFFFRRMIPLPFTEPQPGWPPYRLRLSSLEELLPGASRGLDVICDGILSGSEFIYPAESLALGRAAALSE